MLVPKAKYIKDLRKRHKLTQVELAASLYGVKRDRIKDWELGRRRYTPIMLWAMVLTWDKIDLWDSEQELKWKEKYDT